jgi:hypothetical protein
MQTKRKRGLWANDRPILFLFELGLRHGLKDRRLNTKPNPMKWVQ